MEGRTGKGTGKGTERIGHRESNGTRKGEMEGPTRAGRAAKEEDKKAYVGRGCPGVLGVYSGE